jgi:hypothetical protein
MSNLCELHDLVWNVLTEDIKEIKSIQAAILEEMRKEDIDNTSFKGRIYGALAILSFLISTTAVLVVLIK